MSNLRSIRMIFCKRIHEKYSLYPIMLHGRTYHFWHSAFIMYMVYQKKISTPWCDQRYSPMSLLIRLLGIFRISSRHGHKVEMHRPDIQMLKKFLFRLFEKLSELPRLHDLIFRGSYLWHHLEPVIL